MSMKALIDERLQDLGITHYEIAKRVAKARSTDEKIVKTSQVVSTVRNTLLEPDGRQFSLVGEVIKALGGKIVIEWENKTVERRAL